MLQRRVARNIPPTARCKLAINMQFSINQFIQKLGYFLQINHVRVFHVRVFHVRVFHVRVYVYVYACTSTRVRARVLTHKIAIFQTQQTAPLLPLPEINLNLPRRICVTRDQPRPGSFLKKREEPGNEVALNVTFYI
jgi:hypothetical protein